MTAQRAARKTAAKKAPVTPHRPGPRYDPDVSGTVGGIATDDGGRPLVDEGGRPIRKDA